ncbi:MAG: serine/threonine protein kinase [Kofleriaceae bacterium]
MDADPLIDTIVGERYRVIRKIAEGGMSAIYEVQHVKLLRQFALKRLLPELLDIEEAIQRFQREAELLGGLHHPNVVEISDWVTLPDGAPAMVLEFLHGNSLQVRLLRGALQWDAIARIGDQTMSALQLAHRNGITHRDLKPENIFISIDDSGDERVKLLDFGVSKLRQHDGSLSALNRMLGTPSYMSPEQAAGDGANVGESTDVWAMGTILYEMATKELAYKAPEVGMTLTIILEGNPPSITQFRKDAPKAFVSLVERAISRDPTKRIMTIDELRSGLRAALEPKNAYRLNTPVAGVPIVMPPVDDVPRTGRSTGSQPLLDVSPPVPAKTPTGSGPLPPTRIATPTSPPTVAVTVRPSNTKTWLLVTLLVILATAVNIAIALFM